MAGLLAAPPHAVKLYAVALVLCSTLPMAAAQATDPPAAPKGKSGFGSRGGPLLTRNELRACFARQDRIRRETEALARERVPIDAERTRLADRGATLKAELAALDRSSQAEVDAYNLRAAERDRRVDAWDTTSAAYNRRAEALQAEKNTFAKTCDNRRYDEADEIALRKQGR